jgi:acetolactate synthase-1/3 small subunit
MSRHSLSILAADLPGVLVKVATVISGRGLNIHEMTAKTGNPPGQTRIVIDFLGEEETLRQVRGQLEKLEVVREVSLLTQ